MSRCLCTLLWECVPQQTVWAAWLRSSHTQGNTSSVSGEICEYGGENLVNEEITACADANSVLKNRLSCHEKNFFFFLNLPIIHLPAVCISILCFHFFSFPALFTAFSTDLMLSCLHSFSPHVSLMYLFINSVLSPSVKWKARDTQV